MAGSATMCAPFEMGLLALLAVGCVDETAADCASCGAVQVKETGGTGGDVGVVAAQAGTTPLPACDPGTVGARTTWDAFRHTLPWSVGFGDAGDAGGTGGAAPAVSGCTPPNPTSTDSFRCTGTATVARSDAGLALTFEDGSTLLWNESLVPVAIAPPAADHGATVWADFHREYGYVCPVCGSYERRTIEIRDAPAGRRLWVGAEGHELAPTEPALVDELFGVTVRYEPVCVAPADTDACLDAELVEQDVVLETNPEQVVRRGERATITTPGGAYEVLWAASETSRVDSDVRCLDGPALTEDRAFAASWRP